MHLSGVQALQAAETVQELPKQQLLASKAQAWVPKKFWQTLFSGQALELLQVGEQTLPPASFCLTQAKPLAQSLVCVQESHCCLTSTHEGGLVLTLHCWVPCEFVPNPRPKCPSVPVCPSVSL